MQADLDRARRGDVEAFVALFEQWRPALHRIACRWAGENDAEDVVMDSFLKAWKALPSFRGGSSLKTWLYRIAYRCAADCRRRRERAEPAVDGEGARESIDEVRDPAARTPAEDVASREMEDLVGRALERLSPEHRATLLLRFADGMSYAEIAAATDVSIGTVMSRLFNARRRLMRTLREMETDWAFWGGVRA